MIFANETVVITGASSGIGWAMAKEFARQGAKVGLMARREEELLRLCDEIRQAGGIAEHHPADVSDRESVHTAIAALRAKLGPIDRLIANAGIGSTNPMGDLNIPEAEMVIRVNLLGVMYSIEAVLSEMLERNSGHIVAISSLAGYKGFPTAAAYCASKSAVNAYMESLRIQYHRKNIFFTTIRPGFIRTPMTAKNQDMMFVLDAEPAARRMCRAIAKRKSVYNFPWLTYRLVRLTTWLPDWVLYKSMPKSVFGRAEKK